MLLRQDCFLPMLEGISDIRRNKLDPRDMRVYKNTTIVAGAFSTTENDGMLYLLKFEVPSKWHKVFFFFLKN